MVYHVGVRLLALDLHLGGAVAGVGEVLFVRSTRRGSSPDILTRGLVGPSELPTRLLRVRHRGLQYRLDI